MPPSEDHFNAIRFGYAQAMRRAARRRRINLIIWLTVPPAATAIGWLIGYTWITHHLPGF